MEVAFSITYAGTNFAWELDPFANELVFAEIPVIWAMDWDFIHKNRWAMSWCKSRSLHIKWNVTEKVTEEGHNVLLDKFGLSDWKDEFSLERIIGMSPAQLAEGRRKKEKEKSLPCLEIISDTFDVKAGIGQVKHLAEEYV